MPLTVNIVSGSALTVNMGFAQIGGAKIKKKKIKKNKNSADVPK
jgi:hypothetical protein